MANAPFSFPLPVSHIAWINVTVKKHVGHTDPQRVVQRKRKNKNKKKDVVLFVCSWHCSPQPFHARGRFELDAGCMRRRREEKGMGLVEKRQQAWNKPTIQELNITRLECKEKRIVALKQVGKESSIGSATLKTFYACTCTRTVFTYTIYKQTRFQHPYKHFTVLGRKKKKHTIQPVLMR